MGAWPTCVHRRRRLRYTYTAAAATAATAAAARFFVDAHPLLSGIAGRLSSKRAGRAGRSRVLDTRHPKMRCDGIAWQHCRGASHAYRNSDTPWLSRPHLVLFLLFVVSSAQRMVILRLVPFLLFPLQHALVVLRGHVQHRLGIRIVRTGRPLVFERLALRTD